MKNSFFRRGIGGAVAALGLASAAWGFVLRTDDSGVYVVKWNSTPVAMQVKLSSAANLIDGNSQRSSVAAAMAAWNAQIGTLQLSPQLSSPGAYSSGNGVNEIVMDNTMDGDAFPAGVLAITLLYSRGDDVSETDIIFNTAYTWNSYRGSLRRGTEDLQRVAIHELGHVLGLEHPDEYSQYVTAIMNSHESDLDGLQSDDIAGGHALYGMPGVVPANNRFSDAEAILSPSNVFDVDNEWAYGSNIGADRETGEPNHAGTSRGHSVWWKWVAPANGRAVASTFGSNFDTVLAVYTGANLSTLTPVGDNDDEQRPEDNPTPQRIRTSKVTFAVTKGTTYAFAVDGFAGEIAPGGYTGRITLNLNFTVLVPPDFTLHPQDQTVQALEVARFDAFSAGRPFPTFGWQRLAAGTSTWVDVSTGGPYEIRTNRLDAGSLLVTTSLAMEGDKFRCVATNEAGTANSNVATLHVTAVPLPVITAAPTDTTFYSDLPGELTVTATGATSYQWFHGETAVPGATSASLTIAEPQAGDAGSYRVVISNGGGSVVSPTVVVKVIVLPIVTNSGAARQVLNPGDTLRLSASATGTGTLKYQWMHDGWPVAGETAASLTRSSVTPNEGGAYWLAVTDDQGTRHGPPQFVTIARGETQVVTWGTNVVGAPLTAPASLKSAIAISAGQDFAAALKPDGRVVRWGPLSASEATIAGWTDIVAVSTGWAGMAALRADGTVRTADLSDPVPAGLKDVAAIASGANFVLALRTNGTVVTWPRLTPPAGLRDVVAVACGAYHALALKRDGTVVVWGNYEGATSAPPGLADVVAIAGGMNHSLALKRDGAVVAWGSGYQIDLQTQVPAAAASGVTAIAAGFFHSLALKTDGTVVGWGQNNYGQMQVPAGLGNVFAITGGAHNSYALRESGGDQRPEIRSAPNSQTVIEGGGVTFSVEATGNGTPVTYQWRKGGVTIPGAIGPTLTLTEILPGEADVYDVQVTNQIGTTTTTGATLTVTPLPSVTLLSAGRQFLYPGETFALNVTATGVGRLSYQWYHDGRPISGATGPAYRHELGGRADEGAYWVVVTDEVGPRYAAPIFVNLARRATKVVAWGDNFQHQIDVPPSLTTAMALAAGWEYSMALKLDGTTTTWGYLSSVEPLPAEVNDLVAIAVGRTSTVALKADGTVIGRGAAAGVPAKLRNVWAIASGANLALALKTDGTVVGWAGAPAIPAGLNNVVAIAAGAYHALALKADGTVVDWGEYMYGGPPRPPAAVKDFVAIAGGMSHALALKRDGTVVGWGSNGYGQLDIPVGLTGVVAIAAGADHSLALKTDGTVVAWGTNNRGTTMVPPGLQSVISICAGPSVSMALQDLSGTAPPRVAVATTSDPTVGGTVTLTAQPPAGAAATFQWQRNGTNLPGATQASLPLLNLQPADAGLYTAVATSSAGANASAAAILGLTTTRKVVGGGVELLPADVHHVNGNVFDQVLLTGTAGAVTCDSALNQITRTSYIDLDDDIVQVEFSGPGTLSLVLADATGPARPEKYNQAVDYMKGHAGIVITGATEATNVSVFTVGHTTAVNQTLFKDTVHYDGIADLAFIAIQSANGRFGGVRAANANFFAANGLTGVYAPGVAFSGPVYVGDIAAFDAATPVLMLGLALGETRITGGDLLQDNQRAVQISGVKSLKFTAGQDSHGHSLPALSNRGVLQQDGVDVTAQIVVNPTP